MFTETMQAIMSCLYVKPGDWTVGVSIGDPDKVSPLDRPTYVGA